jgi:hypothetical protein
MDERGRISGIPFNMPRPRQLVTSRDIDNFLAPTNRDAQEVLPHLVRKLIMETTEAGTLGQLRMAVGDDIRLPGWDGTTKLLNRHPIIPEGTSVWEMGVGSDPRSKANDDFRKRNQAGAAPDPSSTTFVFVTPRVWAGKDDWIAEHKADTVWKDIVVIDAQVLEQWLEFAPGATMWLLHEFRKPIDDIDTLEAAWRRWVEDPLGRPVPTTLPIGGRTQESMTVQEWIVRPTGELVVFGETIDEALVFVLAVLRALAGDPELSHAAASVLVVRSNAALPYVRDLHFPCVIVLANPSLAADFRVAQLRNAHIIVPQIRHQGRVPSRPGEVHLPTPQREAIEKELLSIAYSGDEASRVARESRGSWNALKISMSARAVQAAPWARPPHAARLAPLVLVRRWPIKEHADHKVLERLAQQPYADLHRLAMEFKHDGPLHILGQEWDWKSWRASWDALAPEISLDLIERFVATAVETLGAIDPAIELAPDERWQANRRGKQHPNSVSLRDSLVHSLAMFGTYLQRGFGDQFEWVANRVVRRLLGTERKAGIWLSLAQWLPELAEAAPEVFLDSAEMLVHDEAELKRLFTKATMFGSSAHIHLVWALERMAWSPQFLPRVIVLLARLSEVKHIREVAADPSQAIRSVLLPWLPGTSASVESRLDAFDYLSQHNSDVAWSVGLKLLPSEHDSSMSRQPPQYRNWCPAGERRATRKDYWAFVNGLSERLLRLVGTGAKRWRELIHELPSILALMGQKADDFTALCKVANFSEWTAADRTSCWEELRQTIRHHEQYPDAHWSLEPEQLDVLRDLQSRLTPARFQDEHRWLFSLSARTPRREGKSWKDGEEELAASRRVVVQRILDEQGLDEVLAWRSDVAAPGIVGSILAQCRIDDDIEEAVVAKRVANQIGVDPAETQLVANFVCARESIRGNEWGSQRLRDLVAARNYEGALNLSLALRSSISFWQLLDGFGGELADNYWLKASVGYLELEEAEYAVPRLLRAKRNFAAICVIALVKHWLADKPEDVDKKKRVHSVCMSILDVLPEHFPNEEIGTPDLGWIGHNLADVMNFVESQSPDDEVVASLLFRWEVSWLPLLESSGRGMRSIHRELGRSPDFFVELLSLVYPKRNRSETPSAAIDENSRTSEQIRARANQAWRILHEWRVVPGLESESAQFLSEHQKDSSLLPATPAVQGIVSAAALNNWVDKARELAKAVDRLEVCDDQIGAVFAYAPPDEDGTWPCNSVRACIERVMSQKLDRGFELGIYNRRGCHFVGDTGESERRIAMKFREHLISLESKSPRTARVLRAVASAYDSEATERDDEGQRRDFADP